MRAAVYCRVSTSAQEERGTSLDSQRADCRKLATDLGATIVTEYQDVDSGASWSLAGLMDLVAAAKRKEFDVLLVYDPDRLSRDLTKQLVVRHDLETAGVQIRYVTLRVEATAEGRLLENVRAVIAEYERAKITSRLSRGRRHKASSGHIVGNGWAPYGYQFTRDNDGRVIGLEPDDNRLIVRRIFDLARTLAARSIADQLTAEAIPAYHGGSWTDSTIIGILNNSAYRGLATFGKDTAEVITIPCPPIIPESEWQAVREALARRKTERSARLADDPYLLRARLSCHYCGGALACVPINSFRYYQCLRSDRRRAAAAGVTQCPLPRLPAEPTEKDITRRLSQSLLNPDWLKEHLKRSSREASRHLQEHERSITTLERQRDRLRAQLHQTTERLANLPVDSERYRSAEAHAESIETSIRDITERLGAAQAEPPSADTTAAIMSLMELAERVHAEVSTLTPEQYRELIHVLDVRGVVRDDPEGEKLGRRYHWAVAWSSRTLNSELDIKKSRVRFYTPEYSEWEQKHMVAEVAS